MFNNWERERVDPEGRYPVSGMTKVESSALRLMGLFPSYRMERTRDLFQFAGIDHDDPILVVSTESLELRLPYTEWPHPNIPAMSSRIWKRLDWDGLDDATLVRLVDEARQARLSRYRPCRFCGSPRQPERLTEDACDDCAARHLGIVH